MKRRDDTSGAFMSRPILDDALLRSPALTSLRSSFRLSLPKARFLLSFPRSLLAPELT
jgi:hypothetical protein